jgi:hypothetical protein
MTNLSDFLGPHDTIRHYPVRLKLEQFGNGPYVSAIPVIGSECGCGTPRDEIALCENVIVEKYHEEDSIEYPGAYDMIIKCSNCGKVWRDLL